jgi:nickel/cobalt transporter (NicO) family protein
MSPRYWLVALLSAGLAATHPMGNFSVSHYTRFQVTARGVEITYVLDLAELPTFDLLRQWNLERTSPRAELERKAAEQARLWTGNLQIASGGSPVKPKFLKADLVIADGAGDLPIARITSHLRLDIPPGKLEYEDRNFAERAGWKEIVIDAGKGVVLEHASQGSEDRSHALTQYPQDPTIAPPQDLRAAVEWTASQPAVAAAAKPKPAPVVAPIPQPKGPAAPAPVTMTTQAAPAGSVVKGDFLSRMLHQRELTLGMILIAIVVAFALGAAHALTPGHGKTIVAAYLVGSRGTLKHAMFLGAMVTFTHTVSVFLLGLATLFLFQYVMPEKITQVLGAISGLSIVAIGAWMMYQRIRGIRPAPIQAHHHHHDHDHAHDHHHHDHDHHHAHVHHDHDHHHHHEDEHVHSHGSVVHSHGPGGHVHSHDIPDQISWGSLIALGASGGLVPCESALVLLLSAIALGRAGLGLILLVAFSLGLAIVLMGIGVLVLYAKHLLPQSDDAHRHPAFRWIPVASAGIVVFLGLIMTGVSLGWLRPGWII